MEIRYNLVGLPIDSVVSIFLGVFSTHTDIVDVGQ